MTYFLRYHQGMEPHNDAAGDQAHTPTPPPVVPVPAVNPATPPPTHLPSDLISVPKTENILDAKVPGAKSHVSMIAVIVGIFGVGALVLGGAVYLSMQKSTTYNTQSKAAAPAETVISVSPTPQTNDTGNSQLDSDLNAVDQNLSNSNTSMTNADQGLQDQAPDLSQ